MFAFKCFSRYKPQIVTSLLSRHLSSHPHFEKFVDILGSNAVLTTDLDSYNTDWLGAHHGHSSLVLLPRTTDQVSRVMKHCHQHDLKTVVQSGNTSLVAGSVPVEDEVILSMRHMNRIISFDENLGVLQCEAGCVLQHLEEFANQRQRIIPYDLGAKGSCLIGGNLATNAGGLRFVKYGPLHANVLGIEVVLPDGTIVDLMSCMRKDNTGYHLRHLFIGSEGTLGVITKVSILCPIAFRHRIVSLVALETFEHLLQFYLFVQQECGEYLTCFEMMDDASMKAVIENLGYPHPLKQQAPFYVLFELSANDGPHLEGRLLALLEQQLNNSHKSGLLDGTYAAAESDSEKKFQKLKSYRESITEALRMDGHGYKYDISLPLSVYYHAVEQMRVHLAGCNYTRICGYGHLGDCNLHFNVTSRSFEPMILNRIEPYLYEFVEKHRGSISAEHGIGYKKREYLHYSKSAEAIELMRKIKHIIDPGNVLNPNKVL